MSKILVLNAIFEVNVLLSLNYSILIKSQMWLNFFWLFLTETWWVQENLHC